MTETRVTSAVLGIGLAAIILFLLRRDHIYLRDALFWIGVALASIAFGLWPWLVDVLGGFAGVAYPPTLLMIVGGCVLAVRALFSDIAMTALRRDLRRLNQRIAMMEISAPEARSDPSGGEMPSSVGNVGQPLESNRPG